MNPPAWPGRSAERRPAAPPATFATDPAAHGRDHGYAAVWTANLVTGITQPTFSWPALFSALSLRPGALEHAKHWLSGVNLVHLDRRLGAGFCR